MSFKTRVIVGVSLIVVLAFLYGLGISRTATRPGDVPLLGDADIIDDVLSVGFEGPEGQEIVLEKSGESWRVSLDETLFPARADRVESLLNALAALTTLRTVTDNPERHDELEVGDATATRLSITRAEGSDIELLFGSLASQGGESFVRRQGDDSVFAVDSSMQFYFSQPSGYWAELRLVRDVAPEDIVELSVSADVTFFDDSRPIQADYRVTRSIGEEWEVAQVAGPSAAGPSTTTLPSAAAGSIVVDVTEMSRIAAALADLQAGELLLRPEGDLFADPSARFSFTTGDGRSFRFEVGRDLGENQFALRGEGPTVPRAESGPAPVFVIGAWSLSRVVRNLDAVSQAEEE